MRNFGILKSIVENYFVSVYKKPEFKKVVKEFKEFMDNNKEVGKVYLNYGSIMKMNNLKEDVAREFLSLSVEDIKNTIKENKKQFQEFDSWVETLNEKVENNYKLLDDLVFAKTSEDFVNLVESKKELHKRLTETKIEEKTITETINIPLENMFGIAADTFAKEFSTLSESELFELRSLLKMSTEELNEGIERLKTEVITKLDSVQPSDEETRTKIKETKERVEKTFVDTISYYKLKKLSEGL